jgi:hypothetical protein
MLSRFGGDSAALSGAKTGVHMTRTSTASALMVCGFLLCGEALFAQNSGVQTAQPVTSRANAASIDEEIAMLRSDLRSNRKQVVAANMKLTDTQAEMFWPIYEQYVSELVKINDSKYALIKEYLQSSNMTEEQADGISKRWIEVDASVVQLRLKYIPIFRKALSAKGTAMFFQIDRRVQMMIDLQLASAIPLIQPDQP